MLYSTSKDNEAFKAIEDLFEQDRKDLEMRPPIAWNPKCLEEPPIVSLDMDQILEKPGKGSPFWMGSIAAGLFVFLGVGAFFLWQSPEGPVETPFPHSAYESSVKKTPMKAIVLSVKGQVEKKETADAWVGLHKGDVFEGQPEIRTGANSWLDLSLANGLSIHLEENSSLVVDRASTGDGGNRFVVLNLGSGGILATVEKMTAKSEIGIITPTAVAGVRGTVFHVKLEQGQTKVEVLEGAVQVQGRWQGADPVVLDNGKSVEIQTESYTPVAKIEPSPVLEEMEARVEELRKQDTEIQEEMGPALIEARPVSSEEELMNRFDRGLELIELNDGRSFRGMIISQSGNRVVVQTLGGVHIIDKTTISRVLFLDP